MNRKFDRRHRGEYTGETATTDYAKRREHRFRLLHKRLTERMLGLKSERELTQ